MPKVQKPCASVASALLGKKTQSVDPKVKADNRLSRWAAKNAAAKLVYAVDHKAGERLSKCGYCAYGGEVTLTATKRPDGSISGAISGVIACGNLWACPVCSARISAERRDEMNTLLSWARGEGHAVVMATLTFRHHARMPCASSLDAMKRAAKRLRQSKTWRKVNPRTVTALEVTHGRNGWHAHQHVLMVLPMCEADALAAVETLGDPWRAALQKEGLSGNARAFDVQSASKAGEYIAKFGAAEELTLGQSKQARDGGRTPWQLLSDARDGDEKAGRLFQEYALAFKGKRQLVWSKGLKAACGVDQPAEAESEGEEPAAPVVVRTWLGGSEGWRQARRRRCALIAAVEVGTCLDAAEYGATDADRWRRTAQNALVVEPEPAEGVAA